EFMAGRAVRRTMCPDHALRLVQYWGGPGLRRPRQCCGTFHRSNANELGRVTCAHDEPDDSERPVGDIDFFDTSLDLNGFEGVLTADLDSDRQKASGGRIAAAQLHHDARAQRREIEASTRGAGNFGLLRQIETPVQNANRAPATAHLLQPGLDDGELLGRLQLDLHRREDPVRCEAPLDLHVVARSKSGEYDLALGRPGEPASWPA